MDGILVVSCGAIWESESVKCVGRFRGEDIPN